MAAMSLSLDQSRWSRSYPVPHCRALARSEIQVSTPDHRNGIHAWDREYRRATGACSYFSWIFDERSFDLEHLSISAISGLISESTRTLARSYVFYNPKSFHAGFSRNYNRRLLTDSIPLF